MSFDPFASIALICVLLIIVIIIQALVINKILARGYQAQAELTSKLMSKDFKDYADGRHLIDMGLAAKIKATMKKMKPERDDGDYDDGKEPDEIPIV